MLDTTLIIKYINAPISSLENQYYTRMQPPFIKIDEKAQTVTISLDLGKAILRSEITEHAATLIVENESLKNRLAQKNKYDYYTTLIIFFAGVIGGAWTALMAFKFSL